MTRSQRIASAIAFLITALGSAAEAKPPPAAAKIPQPPRVAKPEGTVDELLTRARRLFDALEYDQVIPVTEAVLEKPEIDIEKRLDAYLLQGSCLAIVGSPIDAEKPFRFLLRGRPEYDMPPETPPKILAVFRKVQVEEKTIVDQMRMLERKRMIEELALQGDHPRDGVGGQPVEFEYRVTDPRGVVEAVDVNYRLRGQPSFSSLALERDDSGTWHGAIPGEWTANDEGAELEYYLSTKDRTKEPLIEVASALTPLTAHLDPGIVEDPKAFYERTWFWIAASVLVVGGSIGGYIAVERASALPESDLGTVHIGLGR